MGIICLFLIESLTSNYSFALGKKITVFFKVTHEQFLASKDRDQNKLQLLPKNHLLSWRHWASLIKATLGWVVESTK